MRDEEYICRNKKIKITRAHWHTLFNVQQKKFYVRSS